MKLTLKLNRRVYSKKNSRRMIVRGGRRFFVPSKGYEMFAANAKADIWEQLHRIPSSPIFDSKVRVFTDFYVPGKTKVDGDNLHTSILDILQDAKIISDDSKVLEGHWEKYLNSDGWQAIITIEEI